MKTNHDQPNRLARFSRQILSLPALVRDRAYVMKLRGLLPACAAFLVAMTAHADFVIPGLYNTGVDDYGNVLHEKSQDAHYSLTGQGNQAYVFPIVFHPDGSQAWVTPPPGSAWIGPSATGSTYPIDPPGDYFYSLRLMFDLTGVGDPSLVQISGLWATDNTGQIWVNGTYAGFNKNVFGFTRLDAFLLQGMFLSGPNTVEFRVNNEYGPTGLLVAGLRAVDDGSLGPLPPPVIPEPSTFVGGLLLLLPLAARGLRRLRALGRRMC